MNMKKAWLVGIAALFAATYVLLATAPYGPGITSDSVHYIASARNLLRSGELETYTRKPLVSYAPLLPFAYAVLAWGGVPILLSARLISALSFAAVVVIAGLWTCKATGIFRSAWLVAVLVLLARPLLWYSPYALSELPFVAFTLVALWSIWRFVQEPKNILLMAAVVCSALSVLTRYIGLTAVLAGMLFLLYRLRGTTMERVTYSLVYSGLSCVPFAVWLWRNQHVSGTFFGIREASDYRYHEMLFDTLWSWSRWVIPAAFPKSVTLFTVFLILLVAVSLIQVGADRRTYPGPLRDMLSLMGTYTVIYGAALVLTARSAKFEELSERLWLPIVVPVVMLLAGVAAIDAHTRSARWFNMFLAVFAAGWIVSGMLFAGRMLHKCFSDGPGVFNTAAWRQSPTIRFMRNSALKGFFYSNFPEPLYYYTGIVSYQGPHKGPMRVASETLPRNLQQFLGAMQAHAQRRERVYLVWFHNTSRGHYLYSLSDLGRYLRLREVRSLPDGKVVMPVFGGQQL
jgi:4-amino-4-deoxy-L-arabinose transferase-like glycosyltransferase